MMMRTSAIICAVALAAFGTSESVAQSAAESLKGKTVTVYIPVGPGGGYDAHGRMIANSIGRYLPGNPTVIASNMPGGGGRKLANYMYNAAPKEGSAIAIIHHTTVYDAAFGSKGVQYDSTKFNWLGSTASVTLFLVTWHESGVKTLEDATRREISVGATGAGATSYQYLSLIKNMFGAKFKIVTGYKGARDIYMAVERKELDGTGGMAWETFRNNYGHLLRDRKVNLLAQIAMDKNPELEGVPHVLDMARNAEEKQVLEFALAGLKFGRPFMTPPGVPTSVVEAYRKAFLAAAADPKLHAEAKKRKFQLDPTDGATVQRLVDRIYNAPPAIKAKAKALLTAK